MRDIKDINWLAGFLEGEGSFMMTRNGKKSRMPRLTASQKQRWPLEKVLSIIRLGNVHYIESIDMYFYNLYCNNAIQWMMTLYSLMSPRRQEQIRKVIELWKNSPGSVGNGSVNRNKTHCPKGHEYTKENTYMCLKKNGKISRSCRICGRRHRKEYYEKSGK